MLARVLYWSVPAYLPAMIVLPNAAAIPTQVGSSSAETEPFSSSWADAKLQHTMGGELLAVGGGWWGVQMYGSNRKLGCSCRQESFMRHTSTLAPP